MHVCMCIHVHISHGWWELSSSPCKSSELSTAALSRPLTCMPSSAPIPRGSRAVTIMVMVQTDHQLLHRGCSGDKIFKPLGSISKSSSHSLKFLEKVAYDPVAALTETDVCFRTLQLSASLGWGRAGWERFFLAGVSFYVSVSKSQNKFYHRVPQNRVAAFWVAASPLNLALPSLHIPTQKLYPTFTQCPCLGFMATLKFQVHLVHGFVFLFVLFLSLFACLFPWDKVLYSPGWS